MGFTKGMIPWNKGKKGVCSEETKEKMKGKIPWNKGLTKESDERVAQFANKIKDKEFSITHRMNLSLSHQGKIPWNKGIKRYDLRDEQHPRWKGGKSNTYLYREYYEIRDNILKKHPFCSICNNKEDLFCHHIDKNSKNNNENNLLVICRGCHTRLHRAWEIKKAGG